MALGTLAREERAVRGIFAACPETEHPPLAVALGSRDGIVTFSFEEKVLSRFSEAGDPWDYRVLQGGRV